MFVSIRKIITLFLSLIKSEQIKCLLQMKSLSTLRDAKLKMNHQWLNNETSDQF